MYAVTSINKIFLFLFLLGKEISKTHLMIYSIKIKDPKDYLVELMMMICFHRQQQTNQKNLHQPVKLWVKMT